MTAIAAITGIVSGLGGVGGLLGGGPGIGPGGGLAGAAASGVANSLATATLGFLTSGVLGATSAALKTVAHVIGATTTPHLASTWFSSTYWRVAALASLLTLPFLFAAAVQAVLSSDLGLVLRAGLVQLPVALLGVSLVAPLVMLLLAATDEMCTLVSQVGSQGGAQFLDSAAVAAGAASALAGSPFLAIVVGLLTIAAALALMLELLVREAAVYVVVLMLPLTFAAMVWPSRRVWATRMLELLIALIISKFVIVAVLSLAGSALGRPAGVPQLLVAMALVMLSCAAPWALLRLIPFTELSAHASESLRHHGHRSAQQALMVGQHGFAASDAALQVLSRRAAADGQTATHDTGEFADEFAAGYADEGWSSTAGARQDEPGHGSGGDPSVHEPSDGGPSPGGLGPGGAGSDGPGPGDPGPGVIGPGPGDSGPGVIGPGPGDSGPGPIVPPEPAPGVQEPAQPAQNPADPDPPGLLPPGALAQPDPRPSGELPPFEWPGGLYLGSKWFEQRPPEADDATDDPDRHRPEDPR